MTLPCCGRALLSLLEKACHSRRAGDAGWCDCGIATSSHEIYRVLPVRQREVESVWICAMVYVNCCKSVFSAPFTSFLQARICHNLCEVSELFDKLACVVRHNLCYSHSRIGGFFLHQARCNRWFHSSLLFGTSQDYVPDMRLSSNGIGSGCNGDALTRSAMLKSHPPRG